MLKDLFTIDISKTDQFKKLENQVRDLSNKNTEYRSYLDDQLAKAFPDMGFTISSKEMSTPRGALSLSTFFSAVELIANSIASLPVLIKNNSRDEEKKMYFKDMLKNQYLSEYMFKKQLIQDILLYGDGFVYIDRQRTKIKGLRYIPYADISIIFNKFEGTVKYICPYIKDINPGNLIHLYKISNDEGYRGVGIIEYAKRTLELANYTENSAVDYYKKGLNWAGLLSSENPLNQIQAKQAMNTVNGELNSQTGGAYVKFLPFGVKFQALTQTAKDAALLDTRTFNIAEIARYFNISPTLLQDLSHGNFSSFEMQSLSFLTQTLLPYIKVIEDEFTRKLFPNNDYYVDVDETEFVRMQGKDASEYYSKLVSSGIITVNEARNKLGYEKVDEGDKLFIPYTDISQNTIGKEGDSEEDKSDEDKSKEDSDEKVYQNNTDNQQNKENSDEDK